MNKILLSIVLLSGLGQIQDVMAYDHKKEALNEQLFVELAKRSGVRTIEELLNQGANPNACNESGETALMCACLEGQKDVVELLIKRHACIDASDSYGYTALMKACMRGHCAIVQLLLDNKVCIHTEIYREDGVSATALDLAQASGCEDIAKLLLAAGAESRSTRNKITNIHRQIEWARTEGIALGVLISFYAVGISYAVYDYCLKNYKIVRI
jgi:ankyrin repeat protein